MRSQKRRPISSPVSPSLGEESGVRLPAGFAEQDECVQEIKEYLGNVMQVRGKLPDGWQSPEAFLLKYGKPYYIDADTFKGRRAEAKQCYANATHLMLSHDLIYVEGYVHVGCVTKDGRVVDPTLRDDRKTRIYPRAYFGVPFKSDYVLKTALRVKVYGVLNGFVKGIIYLTPVRDSATIET